MKLINWNVNSLISAIDRGFLPQFDAFDADFFCIHGTGLSEGELHLELPGYQQFWLWTSESNPGAAIFTKHDPIRAEITNNHILLEFKEFCLISGNADTAYQKPVIFCDAEGFRIPKELEPLVYRRNTHTTMEAPYPVSLDMDLICNGSILSPTSLGPARVILPTTANEDPKPETKKHSQKGLIALFALAVLLIFGTYLAIPKTEPDPGIPGGTLALPPVTVTVLDMEPYSYVAEYSQPGSNSLSINATLSRFEIDEKDLYTDPIGVNHVCFADTLIRVDVTQEGLASGISTDSAFKAEFRPVSEVYSDSDTVVISFLTHLESAATTPYYRDAEKTQFGGWLIFCQVPTTEEFSLTVTLNEFIYAQNILLTNRFDSLSLQTEVLYNPTFLPELSVSSFGYTYLVNDLGCVITTTPESSVLEGLFWVFVAPSQELLDSYPMEDLTLLVSDTPNSLNSMLSSSLKSHDVLTVYNDGIHLEPIGWLVVGQTTNTEQLELTLLDTENMMLISSTHADVYPNLSDSRLETASTEALWHHVLNHPGICQEMTTSGSDFKTVLYRYAVLEELARREDAAACLLQYRDEMYYAVRKEDFLSLTHFQEKMTPAEMAMYITQNYPSSFDSFQAPMTTDADLSACSTLDLVKSIHGDYALWKYLNEERSPEIELEIYRILRQHSPYLQSLETREDAVTAMEELLNAEGSSVVISKLLTLWPEIQSTT